MGNYVKKMFTLIGSVGMIMFVILGPIGIIGAVYVGGVILVVGTAWGILSVIFKSTDSNSVKDGIFEKAKIFYESCIKKKNRKFAGILSIFLGFIGIHKFYLGDKKKGFIYFLVGTLLSGFGGFIFTLFSSIIEGVKIFKMSDEEFKEKYHIEQRGED